MKTDLDGGVPLPKDWITESNNNSQRINEQHVDNDNTKPVQLLRSSKSTNEGSRNKLR